MKKNTISLAQLTYLIILEQRTQKILETIASTAQSVGGVLKSLGDEVIDAGMDMSDEEVQAALLSKLLDAQGKIEKVDVSDVKELEQQVQEGRGYIQEGGSAMATVAHAAGEVLGNAALIEALSHGLAKITGKKDAEVKAGFKKVQNFFKNLGAITGFPGKVIERSFKWIAAKWGAGEKAQKIFGIAGMMLFVLLMGVIAIISFPSITSVTALVLGLTALIGKSVEMVKLIGHMIHTVKGHEEEIEDTKDKTELQKKMDKWLSAPISGPSSTMGDMAQNLSSIR